MLTHYIFFALFFLSASAFSQTTAPKYSNEFLNIGIGARALGMGNVQVAVANDVTAGYWNPAGLLGMNNAYEVGLMHSEYFAGIAKFDYGAFAMKLDSFSAVAVSVIRFGIDDIPDTRFLYDANGVINYNNIRYFSAADYAFLLSYARKPAGIKGLTLGANFKVIHRVVGDFANAWGFGVDAAAQYEYKKWRFGAMARDVTGTFNAWSHNLEMVKDIYQQTGNELPENSVEVTVPRLVLGAARSFIIKEKFGILASADLHTTFDGKRNTLIRSGLASIDPAAGFEADYKKIIFLRAGVGNFQQIQNFDGTSWNLQPNFGVGVKINRFSVDYALTDLGNVSEALYSNVFSLKVGLD